MLADIGKLMEKYKNTSIGKSIRLSDLYEKLKFPMKMVNERTYANVRNDYILEEIKSLKDLISRMRRNPNSDWNLNDNTTTNITMNGN
jgi:hypothetical protein